jgi:restriction system protein
MPTIPSHRKLLWPALDAVRALGGSGRIDEINEKAIELGRFTEEQQALLHGAGPRTELEYRLAWARTLLKWMGVLDNSTRGVWSLTDFGRSISKEEVDRLFREQRAERLKRRRARRRDEASDDGNGHDEDLPERDWKEALLSILLDLPPDAFERLARRLLREAGFISVTVTGQTGDGGIDGLGVYRLSLVSFPVFFQCKRYRGSVRAGAVRDFRGAMAGRGDKGLLITTGSFTADAKREATRDGAPPIDLIDGDRLCDLLKEFRLGVRVTARTVEDVDVEPAAFDEI